MDPRRRELLLSIALAPLPTLVWRANPVQAAEAQPITGPVRLRVSGAAATPDSPLRYGDGFAVLRARRGVPLRVRLDNTSAVPTSLDLHGIRVSPPLGGAGPIGGAVAAGTSADFAVTPPDAGTSWFHPWIVDPGLDATAQGLAGAMIVDEDEPPQIDADLVALVSDRWPLPISGEARAEDAFRIDGEGCPKRETLRPGSRARVRLINGSTRQAFGLAWRGAGPLVIAIDGQPCPPFRPRGASLPLGPGARTDLVIDMPGTAGSEVSLHIGDAARPGSAALILRADGEPRQNRGRVVALPANPLLPDAIALERATRATLVAAARAGGTPGSLTNWTIDGVSGVTLPKAPHFTAKRGAPVSLTFRNTGPDLVSFRVHGFCLRVLHDLDDGWEPYWRDAVLVPPGATHHAAFVADRPGRWLIESTFFDQAARGLRTWFEVG